MNKPLSEVLKTAKVLLERRPAVRIDGGRAAGVGFACSCDPYARIQQWCLEACDVMEALSAPQDMLTADQIAEAVLASGGIMRSLVQGLGARLKRDDAKFFTACGYPPWAQSAHEDAADSAMARLRNKFDALVLEFRKLEAENERLKRLPRLQTDMARGDYWCWMGDGHDHPQSLVCPVLVPAEQVRRWVKAEGEAAIGYALVNKLQSIGAQVNTQDNAATSDPIFVVYQKRRIYGVEDGYSDSWQWINRKESEDRPDEATVRALTAIDAMHFCDRSPEEDALIAKWEKIGYVEVDVFCTACFTRAAAGQVLQRMLAGGGYVVDCRQVLPRDAAEVIYRFDVAVRWFDVMADKVETPKYGDWPLAPQECAT